MQKITNYHVPFYVSQWDVNESSFETKQGNYHIEDSTFNDITQSIEQGCSDDVTKDIIEIMVTLLSSLDLEEVINEQ